MAPLASLCIWGTRQGPPQDAGGHNAGHFHLLALPGGGFPLMPSAAQAARRAGEQGLPLELHVALQHGLLSRNGQ